MNPSSPRRNSEPADVGRFFVTAAKGTEPLLRDELRELGFRRVRAERGGVRFGASEADAYRACLWTRIGLRVMEPLASFACPDADALYAGVHALDLERFVDASRTLTVRAAGTTAALNNTQFIAQRTKDAVVDRIRARRGARPSVDREDADLVLFLHLARDTATLYADYSGSSLHARGLRVAAGEAPIKEHLAAALVRYSGWDGRAPLVDPMCGAGTLLIEAALWARRVAPGLTRERFGFERWPSFGAKERELLARLRDEARAGERPLEAEIVGSDRDREAIARAKANAERAGVKLAWHERALGDVEPGAAGTLVANPPYGERLEQDRGLSRELDRLLHRFASHGRALIVPRGFSSRRRPERWLAVWNGPIACELRYYAPHRRAERG